MKETPSKPVAAGTSFALLVGLTVAVLLAEGRGWWCACGHARLWDGDIWSAHNSQHLFDAYSFTHVLHGVLFCWGAAWFWPKRSFTWRLGIATLLECVWEAIENSPLIIQRYRAVTISLGYEGDSVINALGDIGCCMLGFALTQRVGWRRSLVGFAAVELALLVTIRDNLTLNVLMLVWPIEAVRAWQSVG